MQMHLRTHRLDTEKTHTVRSTFLLGKLPEVFCHGLGAGVHMEFAINSAGDIADGGEGDLEFVGDFLLEVALGEKAQNILFARGQRIFDGHPSIGWRLLEGLDDTPGDPGAHGRAAFHGFVDRFS
jgi:hypothetical protein